jgi:oligosaccharide repeat unit polymerase
MLLFTTIFVLFLAVLNFFFGRKSPVYPPFLFCLSWGASLLLLWLTGELFYPMLPVTFLFILAAASVFSIFCWVADALPTKRSTQAVHASDSILNWLIFLVAAGTPLYYRWMFSNVSTRGVGSPFLQAAMASAMEMTGKDTSFRVAGFLVEISSMVAMIAIWESDGHKRRTIIAVLAAFAISIPRGQKATFIILAISLLAVDWLKNRKFRWKISIAVALLLIGMVATFEFYVHLGGGYFGGGSFIEQLDSVVRLIALYISGGIVGLDRVFREPSVVFQVNPINVIWLRVLRRVGFGVDFTEWPDFVAVGPHSLRGNVYTVFWSYLNFGLTGAIAFVGLLGFFATRAYKRALQGSQPWVPLCAKLTFAVFLSTFTEYFVSSLYIYFILAVLVWIIYFLPTQWKALVAYCNSDIYGVHATHIAHGPALNSKRPYLIVRIYRNFRNSIHRSVQDDVRDGISSLGSLRDREFRT